jgi:hypothetical protein
MRPTVPEDFLPKWPAAVADSAVVACECPEDCRVDHENA